MRITRNQLRQLIREALEVHLAPEGLDDMGPEEAYGMGYYAGKPDDPDLDDDGFLSVAELVSMVHNMTDDLHEQADRNRDGVLNADELRALADDIEGEEPQIDMRLVNNVMDYIEDHYNKARFDGRYIVGIAPATGPDGRPTQDIKKFDAAVSRRTLMKNVRNWLGY